jgi:tRNA(Ile)-lysidine synthase
MMLHKVRRHMERQRMAEWHEPLWVAVSGGLDSMVLLHLLRVLRHPVSVVHVDHGLRGEESTADLQFVRDHCEELRIPFRGMKVDVAGPATEQGVSTQMAARTARYEVFHGLVKEGPSKMALAHHQDDAIETLFMQMMKGMGAHGWRTIPPVSGPFIRPLMNVGREEIEAYAEEHNIQFREDPSNAERKYLRNKIRHELLPMLEGWRPGMRRSLARSVHLFREMDHLTRGHLEQVLGRDEEPLPRRITISAILDHGTPRLALHHLLRRHGFHPDRLENILLALEEGATGTTFQDRGIRVTVDRDVLIIDRAGEVPPSWTIVSLDDPPIGLPLEITRTVHESIDLSRGAAVAWLDADRLQTPLEYRPWRAGDRMRPIGMQGSKLISDILVDARVPRNEKDRVYVLVSGQEIVWLAGFRVAEGSQATEASQSVIRMAMKG